MARILQKLIMDSLFVTATRKGELDATVGNCGPYCKNMLRLTLDLLDSLFITDGEDFSRVERLSRQQVFFAFVDG